MIEAAESYAETTKALRDIEKRRLRLLEVCGASAMSR